ncbi:MAG: ABC transporter ATP-binding protein, partial [Parasporobacterium sp.]|nr:ABC transporter ATP-binding protein [Parasporobacterium sp.]
MLLEVKDLCVEFHNDTGTTTAVDHISFNLEEGEILGIVGESGSGKSVTSLSVMGLLPSSARYSGQVLYEGADFVTMNFEQLRQFKGDEISMVFQEALTSLNPLIKVGKQCEEMLVLHKNDPDKKGMPVPSKAERKARVLEMFSLVELPEPEVTYNKYPHELSGGQQQRVMIAMALMCSPRLLIADEPTTALDADVQDQIVDLLKTINKTTGTAIMFISHDLGLVRKICHNVLVMYKGKIVERGSIEEIFENPKEAYTKKLIAAITDEIKDTAPIEGDNIL